MTQVSFHIEKRWEMWNGCNFRVITMRGRGIFISWPLDNCAVGGKITNLRSTEDMELTELGLGERPEVGLGPCSIRIISYLTNQLINDLSSGYMIFTVITHNILQSFIVLFIPDWDCKQIYVNCELFSKNTMEWFIWDWNWMKQFLAIWACLHYQYSSWCMKKWPVSKIFWFLRSNQTISK